KGNKSVLQKQLEETYGTTIDELNREHTERQEEEIVLHKTNLPPLLIKKKILRFRRKAEAQDIKDLYLNVPTGIKEPISTVTTWTMVETREGRVKMQRVDGGEDILEFASMEFSK